MTFGAIAQLKKVIVRNASVLEFGGGNSTLWFLQRGAHVTTVESSPDWAQAIQRSVAARFARLSSKLNLQVRSGDDAIHFVQALPEESFDIIVIDSANEFIRRNEVVARARSKVKKGGWLILDNSDHPANWGGVNQMRDLPQHRYTGLAPMLLGVSQTSMWRIPES